MTVILRDVEPWLEPVDGSELLTAIADIVSRHVIPASHAAEAIALYSFLPCTRCGGTLSDPYCRKS